MLTRPERPRHSRLVNKSVTVDAGRTSMRLEPDVWEALNEICDRERIGMALLVQRAEQAAASSGGRTSAVRSFALRYFRAASTEEGHRSAGHRMH